MSDKPTALEARVSFTDVIIDSNWQFGPVDLAVPDSGRNMPDVQLEALCDIIFADLKTTNLP